MTSNRERVNKGGIDHELQQLWAKDLDPSLSGEIDRALQELRSPPAPQALKQSIMDFEHAAPAKSAYIFKRRWLMPVLVPALAAAAFMVHFHVNPRPTPLFEEAATDTAFLADFDDSFLIDILDEDLSGLEELL